MKKAIFDFFKRLISSPIIFRLNKTYTFLLSYSKLQGIIILATAGGVLTLSSIVLWCIIYSVFIGHPWTFLEAASTYNFSVYTILKWVELYRLAWLVSAADYASNHSFGPTPAYILYFNTLKYSSLYFPNVALFNLLLIVYMVLFGHCFGVMLHGLIMQKQTVSFKINWKHVAFRMLIVLIILVIFVWCPPVFTPGVPSFYETGDPLNPIDWSKIGCKESSLFILLPTWKKRVLLRPVSFSKKSAYTNINTILIILLILFFAFICCLYWTNPELAAQAWYYTQMLIYKVLCFVWEVLSCVFKQLIKKVGPQKSNCSGPEEKETSANKASPNKSWFTWARPGAQTLKPDKEKQSEGSFGSILTKVTTISKDCDQTLKKKLDAIDEQGVTPRTRDAHKNKAWEQHNSCKDTAYQLLGLFKDQNLNTYGKSRVKETTTYAGSYISGKQKFGFEYKFEKS